MLQSKQLIGAKWAPVFDQVIASVSAKHSPYSKPVWRKVVRLHFNIGDIFVSDRAADKA